MKRVIIAKFLAILILSSSSVFAAIPPQTILKQSYLHKYGGTTSKDEWESRGSTGQVVSVRADGVTVTENYYKGILQGNTTYTVPNSDIIAKTDVYKDGKIVSVITHYPSGVPGYEMTPLSPKLVAVTTWYESGVPRSTEEMDGDLIYNGIYFHPGHEEESRVVEGFGVRTYRDSKGVLLSKDTIQDGFMVLRTTYHPGGEILSLTTYENNIINGTHKIFDISGQPKEIQEWQNGKQNGITTVYENGEQVAVIPYAHGEKNGVERHYQGSSVILEISWLNGLKNGATKKYTPNGTQVQWFLLGQPVSSPKQVSDSLPPIPTSKPNPKPQPAAKTQQKNLRRVSR